MEALDVPQFGVRVHLCFFDGVTNAPELRRALVDASQMPDADEATRLERARLDWAFIEAKMVTSRAHVLAAVHLALLLQASGELRTKTAHSEILWALCPTNNIADAIKKFGLSASTNSLILVKLVPLSPPSSSSSSYAELEAAAVELVKGRLLPLSEIGQRTDWQAVKRSYKLNGDGALKKTRAGGEQEYVDSIVTSLVAAKLVLQ